MDVYVLNNKCDIICLIDYCESVIWTSRYYSSGDFELYLPVTEEALSVLKLDNFVTCQLDRRNIGIITSIQIDTDQETGDYITVKGETIDNLLARRIVWKQTILSGTVIQCVLQLLNENAIVPTIKERKIDNFILGECCNCNTQMKKQVTGDNLLEAVQAILHTYKLGYRVEYIDGKFNFMIYSGTDKSYRQSKYPRVEFSPEYDNLISSTYLADASEYKNIALVAGEGEGINRKTYVVGNASGISRREVYVDARDISSETDDGTLTNDQYNALLNEKGYESLAETIVKESFEGDVDPEVNYTFGTDYYLGDIVQITNEYGISTVARITEVIECWDENGYSCVPTFSSEEV